MTKYIIARSLLNIMATVSYTTQTAKKFIKKHLKTMYNNFVKIKECKSQLFAMTYIFENIIRRCAWIRFSSNFFI